MQENIKECNHCHTPDNEGKTKLCSRCKIVRYCNTNCQKEDWQAHKLVCKPSDERNENNQIVNKDKYKIVVPLRKEEKNKAILSFKWKFAIDGPNDDEKARDLCLEACQEGSKLAKGMRLLNGWGNIPVDTNQAFKIFNQVVNEDKNCEKEETSYCMYFVALIYYNGYGSGIKKDVKKAKQLFEKVGSLKNAAGYFEIAVLNQFGNGGHKKNMNIAVEYYIKAAELGHSTAMYNLGNILTQALGVRPDIQKGIEYYKMGAELNTSDCLYSLGNLYLNGKVVQKDVQLAISYYNKAIALNHKESINNLAIIYQYGAEGVPIDLRTIQLFTRSAEMGTPQAFFNLGMMCERGEGMRMNLNKAIRYYQKAAELGYPYAFQKLMQLQN